MQVERLEGSGVPRPSRARDLRRRGGGLERCKAIGLHNIIPVDVERIAQLFKKASQSSRLGCRECNPIVFPATCAAEKLPEAKRHASPRADQPKGDGARVSKKEPGRSRVLFLNQR